ncbi:MAG TPA: hypothetical protein VHB25_17295 [Gemmatimonadaceae bacterium]|nr:hypothetical protein [Gemmatimonadaceae bacterium]
MAPTPEPSRAGPALRGLLERGFRFEQAGALERALEAYSEALARSEGPIDEAETRVGLARVYRAMARYEDSQKEAAAALRLAEAGGAEDLAAEALNVDVGALQMQGFFDEADEVSRRALARARSPRMRGITLQNLGRGAAERADFASAERYFAESVEAFRAADYEFGLAVALCNTAKAALDQNDAARSLAIGGEAMAIARRQNALDLLLNVTQNQAAAYASLGQFDSAESLLTEALGHFTSARNVGRQAECLELMGQLSERRGDDRDTAVRCYRRALDLALAAKDHPLTARLTSRIEALTARAEHE